MIIPYDYQEEAVSSIIDFLKTQKGNPLVSAPTGSGKSIMIASLITRLHFEYPSTRILMCVHQKELIEQNFQVFTDMVGPIEFSGIHSASIGRKDVRNRIIWGQIQSMYKKAMNFGKRHLMIIDECHMVPHKSNGRYRHFIEELQVINPAMRVVGFSATPYRLKGGDLTDPDYGETIFTDVCYNISIQELINKGKLCNIITVKPNVSYNTDNVNVGSSGEFVLKDLAKAIEQQLSVTEAAVEQIISEGRCRNKWLIFTSNVSQAQIVNEMLKSGGIKSEYVSGKTGKTERERVLSRYRAGETKCLVNCMLYTTGFDVPSVDMVVLLRSTMSAGLYMQMVGRTMRIFPGKMDGLVLDFGGNIARHGPIDDIKIKKRAKQLLKNKKGAPEKACPSCFNVMPIQLMECLDCGFIFPEKPKHSDKASTEAILNCNRWFIVTKIDYDYHCSQQSGQACLLVKYTCEDTRKRVFREFICIGYKGYAGVKAKKWFEQRRSPGIDSMNDYAKFDWGALMRPLTVRVADLRSRYPEVTSYEFAKEQTHDPKNRTKS